MACQPMLSLSLAKAVLVCLSTCPAGDDSYWKFLDSRLYRASTQASFRPYLHLPTRPRHLFAIIPSQGRIDSSRSQVPLPMKSGSSVAQMGRIIGTAYIRSGLEYPIRTSRMSTLSPSRTRLQEETYSYIKATELRLPGRRTAYQEGWKQRCLRDGEPCSCYQSARASFRACWSNFVRFGRCMAGTVRLASRSSRACLSGLAQHQVTRRNHRISLGPTSA